MSVWTLVTREIRHRWGACALSAVVIALAVAVVVASELLLVRDRAETEAILSARRQQVEQLLAARQADVEQAGAELQDAIRKQMTKLGFNVLILPQQQDLAELHLQGTLSATMPEEYVSRLAASGIVTVNHLLPMVTRRMLWPERQLEVILVGTRGETPILHRAEKKPLLAAVPPGEMVLGAEVQSRLGVQPGEQVTFLGRTFQVTTIHPQRGTADDVTIWIDLAAAQELLGLQNLIHGILALECECAGDRISQVRQEIQGILPGTQVVERYSQALARAEARNQAKQTADQALAEARRSGEALLAEETASRAELERQHARLAGWLGPAVVLAAAAWVGGLAWLNVRQRRAEIGILRAIGLGRRNVLQVFLAKAVLIGTCGGALGLVLALVWSARARSPADAAFSLTSGAFPAAVWIAPLAAPLLAAVASWLPAMAAARQDPAAVLERE